MAYTLPNFPSKNALKDAIAVGQIVTVFQVGRFGAQDLTNGVVAIESVCNLGYRRCADVSIVDGRVTKVK